MDENPPLLRDPKRQTLVALISILIVIIAYALLLGKQATATDVALGNGVAYAAVNGDGGMRVLSLQDPNTFTEIGVFNVTGSIYRLLAYSQYIFVANGNQGLRIVDVSNPLQPAAVSTVSGVGDVRDVAVAGNYAYLASMTNGLVIVDISNPASPRKVSQLSTPGGARGVDAVIMGLGGAGNAPSGSLQAEGSGAIAFVADGGRGIQVIDALSPLEPRQIGGMLTPSEAKKVRLSWPYLYIADGIGGLLIADANNPAAPAQIGSFKNGGDVQDVKVDGSRAYLAAGSKGVAVVDISNPQAPRALWAANVGGNAQGIAEAGQMVYLAAGDQGVKSIAEFTPGVGEVAATFETPGETNFLQTIQAIPAFLTGKPVQSKAVKTLIGMGGDVVLLLLVFCFWLAFFAQFVLPVHTIYERRMAVSRIFTYLSGGHGEAVFIHDGKEIKREREESRRGPGVMVLDTASAAVLRSPHAFTRAIGPGITFFMAYEYLAGVVSLMNQNQSLGPNEKEDPFAPKQPGESEEAFTERQKRRYETSASTRDAVEVVPYISVSFRLDHDPQRLGGNTGKEHTQFGFNPQSVWAAIAHEGVFAETGLEQSERVASWEWLPVQLAVDVWREYLRKFTLDQLFAFPTSPDLKIPPGQRKTAFDRIVGYMNARLTTVQVEELDDTGKPTGVKRPSREYVILRERGIKVQGVSVRSLHFLKDVEEQMVSQWIATWQERADDDYNNALRELDDLRQKGVEQAQKDFALNSCGPLAASLRAGDSPRIAPSLDLLVQGTIHLCARDAEIRARLSTERDALVEIIEWLRKQ